MILAIFSFLTFRLYSTKASSWRTKVDKIKSFSLVATKTIPFPILRAISKESANLINHIRKKLGLTDIAEVNIPHISVAVLGPYGTSETDYSKVRQTLCPERTFDHITELHEL